MGEGIAWFASQHGRNRNERSPREHSHCVTVRANRARKPFSREVLLTFAGSKVRGQLVLSDNQSSQDCITKN